jgi:hypothetical protein
MSAIKVLAVHFGFYEGKKRKVEAEKAHICSTLTCETRILKIIKATANILK